MPSSSSNVEDRIAQACLDTYKSLGPKGKPLLRKDGVREWSVLAGFVLHDTESDHLEVVSLGTGLKCLSADKLPLYGDVLHDSHAEIIARRGLLLWLYGQIDAFHNAEGGTACTLEANPTGGSQLRLKPKYKLAMHISTLPCGDASMKLLAMQQDPEVAAAFAEDQPVVSTSLARGRQGFNTASALRTKPARADAISTSSLSCSDKLASYTVLGVQGALLAYFLEPLYIDSYVFGGVPLDLQSDIVLECQRALVGRLGDMTNLKAPYHLHQPAIHFTDLEYPHAKQAERPNSTQQTGSYSSLSWIQNFGTEVILQGVKQGSSVKYGVPVKSKARSRTCRAELFAKWQAVRQQIVADDAGKSFSNNTYGSTKQASSTYQAAKASLREGDGAPFSSWIRNDAKYQDFRHQPA
ncbi:adenosine deaminase/editase [Cystobasidium minutum MCA 4210]|uniref:adenosine deaminase/editase n=1 Tax=Cystobasidium minutum MCA 4210 TaxID=1397322 RepID=UPI0034CD10A2|eukprot:jgi/Rhomi1/174536/fgenesh1_kg.8_\